VIPEFVGDDDGGDVTPTIRTVDPVVRLEAARSISWPVMSPLLQFMNLKGAMDVFLPYIDVYDYEKLHRLCTRTFQEGYQALSLFAGGQQTPRLLLS